MNIYSLILTIFTCVMVTIIGTHKNKKDNPMGDLANAINMDSYTINSGKHDESLLITDEFYQFDEFISSKAIITHYKIQNIIDTEKRLVKISATNKTETHNISEKIAFSQKYTLPKLRDYKSIRASSMADLEDENINPEVSFNFNKTVKLAPVVNTQIIDKISKKERQNNRIIAKVGYWDTVHSIESKQGKLLYRPRNKSRSCTYTTAPCGHHQLTVQALKDIGCNSIQCRKDRLNYSKSLKMSKKLLALNEKRLKKNGYQNLEDYQKYLIHQQGASGIKVILGATKGTKLLNKNIKKNMANNSPYSYRQLTRMGSRLAANIFLSHWKSKWEKEKQLVAGVSLSSNYGSQQDNLLVSESSTQDAYQTSAESFSLPLFNDSEIQLALNYKF